MLSPVIDSFGSNWTVQNGREVGTLTVKFKDQLSYNKSTTPGLYYYYTLSTMYPNGSSSFQQWTPSSTAKLPYDAASNITTFTLILPTTEFGNDLGLVLSFDPYLFKNSLGQTNQGLFSVPFRTLKTTNVTYEFNGSSSFNEGTNNFIEVNTTNIKAGNAVTYSVSGVAADRLSSPLNGSLTVDAYSKIKIPFNPVSNNFTDGFTTARISLNGGAAAYSVEINDTSMSPVVSAEISALASSVDEGGWAESPSVLTCLVFSSQFHLETLAPVVDSGIHFDTNSSGVWYSRLKWGRMAL